MSRIIILGSSSGNPSSDRANASLILECGDSLYQFDAGEGFSSSTLRNGIDHDRIGTIIISHTHSDHIAGLFLELQMMHLAKRTAPLSVYLPEEAIDAVKRFMIAAYLFPERLGFELTIKPVKPDPVFRDDNITVYARANSHLSHCKETIDREGHPNRMQSYSYVIRTGDKKIIYSGDIGSFDDYADLLDDCDLLITEGLHLDHDALFERAAESGLKRLVLTHLSAAMYGDPEPIRAQAAKFGIEDFRIAADGLALEL
jgi:ribonuclease BN (tRNA processing enzyme)